MLAKYDEDFIRSPTESNFINEIKEIGCKPEIVTGIPNAAETSQQQNNM